MNNKEILELIRAVSDSNLTSFSYEEGEVKLSFKKREKECIVTTAAPDVEVEKVPVKESAPVQPDEEKEGVYVSSPLVGTFYAAPEENAEPYVRVGDKVKKGQVIAIVEAMKLMNEIEAECDGVVEEILVENAQTVEYGQPLFRISE